MTSPTPWQHLLALAIGVALPAYGVLQHRRLRGDGRVLEPRQKIATYWANTIFLLLLAVLAVLAWRRTGTLATLGLTAPPRRLGVGLLLAAVVLVGYAADVWWQLATPARLAATRAHWQRHAPFMPATAREVRHGLALVVAAATAEEILYRGFLIGYLAWFTPLPVAVAVPALVFGASHLYQGGHAVAKIVLLAALLGVIAVVTRSLWIPMALHFAIDLAGLLLAPVLLAREPAAEAAPLS
jgi:membrane protease YdiL (CAAX protease family)